MKKLLIGLLMLVTTNVMAFVSIDDYQAEQPQVPEIHVVSEIRCVEGYQYLYTLVGTNIAVTQMFKSARRIDVGSDVIKCDMK